MAPGIFRTSEAFELELPIRLEDVGYKMFGVAPFGYHVAEHRYDGHPGLDFEYIPGSKIMAAIGGTVQVFTDSYASDKKTLQINFSENGKNYRLVHTNLSALEPGIDTGTKVTTGQVLGTAGSQTATQGGGIQVTYAMTHFQVDDFSFSYGLTNSNAVTPERYFSAAAKATLEQIWAKSAYHQMICEPFLSNPRWLIGNPTLLRSWTQKSGGYAGRVDFVCDYTKTGIYGYTLYDAAGNMSETGTATVTAAAASNSAIDLTGSAGPVRKGVISVKDNKMLLAYSEPGGVRPADLLSASEYSTEKSAAACATANDAVCVFGNSSPFHSGDAMTVSIVLNWEKLTKAATQADLWVAVQFSNGQIFFRNDTPSGWAETAGPYKQGITSAAKQVAVIDSLAVTGNMTGSYTLYAVMGTVGKSLDELKDALLSNLAVSVLYIVQ